MAEVIVKLCWETNGRGRNVRCHDWDGCPGRAWYSLHDNQYCRLQTLWILDNCIDYIDDRYVSASWPEQDKPASFIDNDARIQKSQPSTAGFTRPIQEVAEVIARLERTGKDGRLLLIEVKNAALKRGWDGIYRESYSQDARNALNYIIGWKRKRLSYRAWLKQREYRKK